MTESVLQKHLNEMREIVARARNLFGTNPVAPPASQVRPEPMAQ
ncbi:MAG: hypothetical protein ACR2JI_03975 [Mycobacterium sp.]